MDKSESSSKENSVVLNIVTKLIEEIEKKISNTNVKPKECPELKLLKEKCCDSNLIVALTAFHGIRHLVERGYFIESQTILMLVSLLPSIHHYGPMVSTVGDVLLRDLTKQTSEKQDYVCPYPMQFEHPIVMILKYNKKSWCEVYNFILQVMNNKEVKAEFKINFLRPIFRHVFWGSSLRGSPFQVKLFGALLAQSDDANLMDFTMEVLLWQELDIQYCLFLQDLFMYLLHRKPVNSKLILSALSGNMAVAVKWLILNGYNPGMWIIALQSALEMDRTSCSIVLHVLIDVITDTPSVYINSLISICKFILLSGSCSKHVAYKFAAVVLNWFITPSILAKPLYQTLEEILKFIHKNGNNWNDHTPKMLSNKYFTVYGVVNKDVRLAVDLILVSTSWKGDEKSILVWLKNLNESDEQRMQLKLHSFIYGIIISERDRSVIGLCLEILSKLINRFREISFSLLCLLFYKLAREKEPSMQRIYLFSLPKLAVKKENVPLIMGIIESLKRGSPKVMTPLIIQLYVSLWKHDNRTYSSLHKMLHDKSTSADRAWDVNVSKALALKEICRMAPHLHAKDLVGVLSTILNESVDHASGLPSAIAIEAVTELCKAYVIDIAGTWNAIQPKLCVDKRPNVIISLCKFFGEIPSLNASGQKPERLVKNIVPVLWKYTFFNNKDIVRNAFRALSNFEIENLDLKLLPELYRVDVKLPKEENDCKAVVDVLNLPYVPPECWIQFLGKIDQDVLQDGGQLVIVMVERELASLPRGLFYNPPEKSEPLNYSYLPGRSICRALVDHLRRHAGEKATAIPIYLTQILRIVSREYSKTLPPLNWSFLEKLMSVDSECLHLCLTLLAKQGSVSPTARNILENYIKSACWDSYKFEEILLLYTLVPMLCKSMSYNTLQNFLESTISLSVSYTAQKGTDHFEKILKNLTEALRNQSVQPSHKILIVRQLEKILDSIPTDNDVLKYYARCAAEFPVKVIEEITSVKENIDGGWLRRAITIRCAIAMRSDIKNPLVWLNEFTEAAARFQKEQNFIMSTIWSIIRSRRNSDHKTWLQELIWRIQASIINATDALTSFLLDVFVSSTVVLSGYDALFANIDDFNENKRKILDLFPHSLCTLLSFQEWADMLPKVALWIQKLLKWKRLPEDFSKTFARTLLTLREANSFGDEKATSFLFGSYILG